LFLTSQVSTLLLKNVGSPGSAQSSPGLSTIAGAGGRDGNGHLPVSVRGKKLSLPALEAECDALWEDIPTAVETVMNELKQYHIRTVTLSADLQSARLNSTSMSTELSTHVSQQQQEILSLQHEIETREINAKKRLEKYKAASQAEFTAQIDRLKGELVQMSQQIDAVAADKAQQVSHLKAERSALQTELDAATQRVQDLTRQNNGLQDAMALAEKRYRVAAQEVVAELRTFPALPRNGDSPSGKSRSSPPTLPFHAATSELDAAVAPEHLLASATVLLRSKTKELTKFLKTRKRVDTQQSDAMKTFFESLNSSFVSVTQSHRAHLLHDQLHLLGGADSPIKSTHTVPRTDHAHLYPYLCGDDTELVAMLRTLEDSIFDTLQRSMNVETHLIHKKKEMDDIKAELAAVKREITHELDSKTTLTTKIHRLEAHLHEQISVVGRTNEEMGEREAQLIRDRELLEADLTEMEEKYQVSSQRSDQLEMAVSNLEEELGGVQQELRDARRTLDEVFSQLQASQGRLGDLQNELRGTQYERDALQQRLQQQQRDNESATARLLAEHEATVSQLQLTNDGTVARLQAELESAQSTIAEHQMTHTEIHSHVLQLREAVSEGNGTQFQLEATVTRLRLQLAQAESRTLTLDAELQETKTKLVEAERQIEAKLEQIVASERQIAELCGEVESHSQSLSQETMTLRQAKDQLAFSSTALAHLQINHSALQKEHDRVTHELAEQNERCAILEGQVDEQTATINELRLQVSSLHHSTTKYEESHVELSGKSEELSEQLRVYSDLESDFHELQMEMSAKVDELEQVSRPFYMI
jgi:chromosome segregation ATPase